MATRPATVAHRRLPSPPPATKWTQLLLLLLLLKLDTARAIVPCGGNYTCPDGNTCCPTREPAGGFACCADEEPGKCMLRHSVIALAIQPY